MKSQIIVAFLFILLKHSVESGSPCPSSMTVYPCFCSNTEDGITMVICPGMKNTSHFAQAMKPLKSLIVDRFFVLNAFMNDSFDPEAEDRFNEVDPQESIPVNGMFPKKWLSQVRVRDLEIQGGKLNGFFLTDDAFEGQAEFLTSLVIKNAGLRGHVCSSCSPPSTTIGFSTKELRRTPLLKFIDLSHNELEVLNGAAFPSTLIQLKKIVLSNNLINRVNDNAFSNLHQLSHLDLSRNELTAIGRKIFRSHDTNLNILDLSYNSIQTLPKDMFSALSGLKEIKLDHNLLVTLPDDPWTKIPSLVERIDLRGNFLVCNCTMHWVSRQLSKTTKILGTCVAPKVSEFQDIKPNLGSIMRPCPK